MARATRLSLLALWTAAAWATTLSGAQAYVDPGSTSVIFQALIAGIAAVGTGIAMFRTRIRMWFRRNKPDQPSESDVA